MRRNLRLDSMADHRTGHRLGVSPEHPGQFGFSISDPDHCQVQPGIASEANFRGKGDRLERRQLLIALCDRPMPLTRRAGSSF